MTPRAPKRDEAKAPPKRARARADASEVPPDAVEPTPEPDPAVGEQVRAVEIAGPARLVVFSVDGHPYAMDIDRVQEIQQIVAIAEIPDDSGAVVGVINLRGTVVPAMDIRRLLGLPARGYGLQTPMVFTRTPRGLIALIVDEVEDVVEVPSGSMQEAPAAHPLAERLAGVCRLGDAMVFVFDVDRLIPAKTGRGA